MFYAKHTTMPGHILPRSPYASAFSVQTQIGLGRNNTQSVGVAHTTAPALHTNNNIAPAQHA